MKILYTLACILSGVFAAEIQTAEIQTEETIIEKKTKCLFSASDAFRDENFDKAINHMNEVDLDNFHSQTLLIKIFSPKFFEIISSPFVQYLFDNNIGDELIKEPWFKMLVIIPAVVNAFETCNPTDKEYFNKARQFILCLNEYKHVAHAYGLIKETIALNGVDCKLGLSYPGVLAQSMSEHGTIFSKTAQLPKKIGHSLFDQNLFVSFRRNENDECEIETIPVSLNLKGHSKETVHLTSLAVLNSQRYGILLALGDRGGDTKYRGIQIYQVQNVTALQNFLVQAKSSLYSPIDSDSFSELLRGLNPSIIDETPVMEQLGAYCGFQSAGELNEISKSLFAAMHIVKSRNGNFLINVEDALDTAKLYIYNHHTKQMNDYRAKTLLRAIDYLEKNKLEWDQPFFEDVRLVEERYGYDSIIEKKYGIQKRACESLPPAYEYYLKQQRYHPQEFLPDQSLRIEKGLADIFLMFKKLRNDFHEALLSEMNELDQKLQLCYLKGFEAAELSYRDKELIKKELSTTNPFYQYSNQPQITLR